MIAMNALTTTPNRKYLNTDSLIAFCRDVYDLPISKPTIYRAQRAGELQPLKRGNRLLFPVADVERWIEGGHSERRAEA